MFLSRPLVALAVLAARPLVAPAVSRITLTPYVDAILDCGLLRCHHFNGGQGEGRGKQCRNLW